MVNSANTGLLNSYSGEAVGEGAMVARSMYELRDIGDNVVVSDRIISSMSSSISASGIGA